MATKPENLEYRLLQLVGPETEVLFAFTTPDEIPEDTELSLVEANYHIGRDQLVIKLRVDD